ncbi:sigma-70 family RNA polymerase sigma factor [Luteolibacter pohnpeiensis]|uniref:Sigma-70 family RNA polymerase sigma factor n=1 Tax=Luteolibacter pohnpeiensis TaxID=454153 RepID=A0A934S4U2_9BACT|nr:sigma-70 family RNA polymerase sigma factor [Luteolibacter pohnpeiensis]MBK1881159.1 sigma-70 family RNA polymerase sigma factor [Luteolibacter pohnpeiensis]
MKSAVAAANFSIMDRSRFSELIRDHHQPLIAYARVLCGHPDRAREIVQDSFVAAWQSIGKFDITRDFGSWLRGIVRNKWREDCRRHRREVPLEEPELVGLEEVIRQWCAESGESGLLGRLHDCRAKLPETLSSAVQAYYDDSNSDGESAAAAIGIPAATFRKRLERARTALRQCLESNA